MYESTFNFQKNKILQTPLLYYSIKARQAYVMKA